MPHSPRWLTSPIPTSQAQRLIEQARMLQREQEHRTIAQRHAALADQYAARVRMLAEATP